MIKHLSGKYFQYRNDLINNLHVFEYSSGLEQSIGGIERKSPIRRETEEALFCSSSIIVATKASYQSQQPFSLSLSLCLYIQHQSIHTTIHSVLLFRAVDFSLGVEAESESWAETRFIVSTSLRFPRSVVRSLREKEEKKTLRPGEYICVLFTVLSLSLRPCERERRESFSALSFFSCPHV